MTLRLQITLALLAVLAMPGLGCAADNCVMTSSEGSVIPDGFGVNIDFTDPQPGELKMLADAGFRWVRMDLKWDITEMGKGDYDFGRYDRLMAALDSYNLRCIFILDYTNPLYDHGQPPRTNMGRQAFARWALSAAKHFAGRKVIWETYNEPNIAQFWPPKPNVDDYIALAIAVGRAFRELPDERLIGPATAGVDFEFLEACFRAGLLKYWSAVSVHPYRRSAPETVTQDYCRLRRMIERYAPTGKHVDIFAGEWGYSAAWPELNDAKQGELLARSWLTNVSNGIPVSIWYDWHDDGTNPAEPEHHFGTVANAYRAAQEPVYEPKPAYLAARFLTSFFAGYRFEQRLDVGSVDDHVLVMRNGAQTALAAWTTASSHRVVTKLPGEYTSFNYLGRKNPTLANSQNGLVINLTNEPVYLRRER